MNWIGTGRSSSLEKENAVVIPFITLRGQAHNFLVWSRFHRHQRLLQHVASWTHCNRFDKRITPQEAENGSRRLATRADHLTFACDSAMHERCLLAKRRVRWHQNADGLSGDGRDLRERRGEGGKGGSRREEYYGHDEGVVLGVGSAGCVCSVGNVGDVGHVLFLGCDVSYRVLCLVSCVSSLESCVVCRVSWGAGCGAVIVDRALTLPYPALPYPTLPYPVSRWCGETCGVVMWCVVVWSGELVGNLCQARDRRSCGEGPPLIWKSQVDGTRIAQLPHVFARPCRHLILQRREGLRTVSPPDHTHSPHTHHPIPPQPPNPTDSCRVRSGHVRFLCHVIPVMSFSASWRVTCISCTVTNDVKRLIRKQLDLNICP